MRRILLTLAVFTGGMTTLAIEISASRLLGNVFGTSNIVWANIIGLMLVYLSAGYFIGGKWADRSPYPETFYRLIAWGAFTSGLVPVLSRPVVRQAAIAVEQINPAVIVGSFISVLILFSIPVTLLGCISPFAIRLDIENTEQAGRTAGRIYAVSTIGSILGTFLPILWLIPAVGTFRTFLAFSLALLTVALIGLWTRDRRSALRHLWMPLLLILMSAYLLGGPFKAAQGQVFETESSYNYIQVVEKGDVRYLRLNDGQSDQSVFAPGPLETYGAWDHFLAAPFFNKPPVKLEDVKRLGVVGLAAGTIPKQYTQIFGPLPIDGWEVDQEIVEVGRTWFNMNEPNLNAITSDGRWGLNQSQEIYTVIGIDAYRPPYIPWHLTTKEFFEEVHDHLSADGVVVLNVGRAPGDRRLVDAMASTVGSVFSSVHIVDVPNTFNSIVYGTVRESGPENLVANQIALEGVGASPILLNVLERTIKNLRQTPGSGIIFTDDWAPIEQLTDSIVIRFLLQGDVDLLR